MNPDRVHWGTEVGQAHRARAPIANEVFSPSPEELQGAISTAKAYREAEVSGTDVISLAGQLVDAAHMRHVEIVLNRAAKAGQL